MKKNKVKINICKTEYTIISEDTAEYITSIGNVVDKEMDNILKNNTRFSVTMAAVLSALKYCDDLNKSQVNCDNLRMQLKEYLEDLSKSRLETDELKRENIRVKQEVQILRKRLSSSSLEVESSQQTIANLPTPISRTNDDD